MKAVQTLAAKCGSMMKSEKGQTVVEYALLLVLVAVAAVIAMQTLGTSTSTQFNNAACTIATGSAATE